MNKRFADRGFIAALNVLLCACGTDSSLPSSVASLPAYSLSSLAALLASPSSPTQMESLGKSSFASLYAALERGTDDSAFTVGSYTVAGAHSAVLKAGPGFAQLDQDFPNLGAFGAQLTTSAASEQRSSDVLEALLKSYNNHDGVFALAEAVTPTELPQAKVAIAFGQEHRALVNLSAIYAIELALSAVHPQASLNLLGTTPNTSVAAAVGRAMCSVYTYGKGGMRSGSGYFVAPNVVQCAAHTVFDQPHAGVCPATGGNFQNPKISVNPLYTPETTTEDNPLTTASDIPESGPWNLYDTATLTFDQDISSSYLNPSSEPVPVGTKVNYYGKLASSGVNCGSNEIAPPDDIFPGMIKLSGATGSVPVKGYSGGPLVIAGTTCVIGTVSCRSGPDYSAAYFAPNSN